MESILESEGARQLENLLRGRHSCRGYLSLPVPHEIIRRILRLAQLTASWSNVQPWQVLITQGAETDRFRDALYKQASDQPREPDLPWPREYRGVYLQRRRACGLGLYKCVGIERSDRERARCQSLENFRFFGAPHVAIITSDENIGVYGAIDCGCYVANLLNAAQAYGVSCVAQAAIASHAPFIRDYFKLGPDRVVVCGISFGYEDPDHPANGFRTERANLREVVTFVGEPDTG